MTDSDPIFVGGESPEGQQRPVAPWMLVGVGVAAGVASAVLFGLTGGGGGSEEPVRSVVTTASVTTVLSPTIPDERVGKASTTTAEAPDAFLFSPLLVVTGEYPDTGVERWTAGGAEDVFRLPWATSGFATDVSGSLFAFSGQSATGRGLFVGRDDRYVVLSATVSTWAWHATKPATLAWVDTSGGQRIVSVSHLGLELVGDRGEGLQTTHETTQLAMADPREWIMGFTSVGVALGVPNPADGRPDTRVIDASGQTIASSDTLRAVWFSDDGWAVAEERRDGPTDDYWVVNADLEEQFELGSYRLAADGVAWSPNGEAVAVVDYTGEDGTDARLQVWNRTGEYLLEMPLDRRAWDVAWLADGYIVMAGTDNSGWSGLLFVDPETGDLTPVQAREAPPVELAKANLECEVLVGPEPVLILNKEEYGADCVAVGVHQDLRIWNKGTDTVSLEWQGAVIEIPSDDDYAIGSIGEVVGPGYDRIESDPYQTPPIRVVDPDDSFSAKTELDGSGFGSIDLGMTLQQAAEASGLRISVDPDLAPGPDCWQAVIEGDPYSPIFTVAGDGTENSTIEFITVFYPSDDAGTVRSATPTVPPLCG